MTPRELVKKYLDEVNIMQLATSDNDQPWACNLHFYADDDLNIYWFSSEDRIHSTHIANNPNAAIAFKVLEDSSKQKDVIGVSIAGEAKCLGSKFDKEIAKNFIKKHKKPADYLDNILDGTGVSKCYVLKPRKIILFDTKNFPNEPRQSVLSKNTM